MTQIEELLIKMLNIPSVSGDEGNLGDFLISELTDFIIKKQDIGKNRFNIIATKGKPNIYIVIHMDTVPGILPVQFSRDKIFGRGAIDNKGNIAGAIMTAKKLENIGLILTVGEEVDFIGAKKIKIKRGKFIVMEPTKLEVMTAQRGVIGFDIFTLGKELHSSLDFKKEESAVYLLTSFIQELYKKNWTSFNAVIIDGGEADNVVCGKTEAKITMRPRDEKEYIKILDFFSSFKRENIKIKKTFAIKPCRSDLIKNNKEVSFFSEMAFFRNSILFGVGDIANAHTQKEFVLRKDLNILPDKLLELIKTLE